MSKRLFGLTVSVLLVLTIVAACGGDDEPVAQPTSAPTTTTTLAVTSTTEAPSTTTSAAPSTTTTAAPTTTSSSTTTTTTSTTTTSTTTTTAAPTTTTLPPPTSPLPESLLPGTNFIVTPVEGAVLAVVGVQYDDVLNVRHAPGTNYAVIHELAPTAENFTATARARMLTQSIWWEVITENDLYGWVSSSFTARRGTTEDMTSWIVDKLGAIPTADSMEALGLIVAEALAPEDTDIPNKIVMVVAPTVGDLGEVTYDIVGLGDDAVHALRAHVFGQPDSGGFSLMSAEVTAMCDSIRGGPEPGEICP